jgi:hypothetical protein
MIASLKAGLINPQENSLITMKYNVNNQNLFLDLVVGMNSLSESLNLKQEQFMEKERYRKANA